MQEWPDVFLGRRGIHGNQGRACVGPGRFRVQPEIAPKARIGRSNSQALDLQSEV
jgi:hypothetical protein